MLYTTYIEVLCCVLLIFRKLVWNFRLTLINFTSYYLKLQEIVSWLVFLRRISDFQEWIIDVQTGTRNITIRMITVKWKYLTGSTIRRVDILLYDFRKINLS